MKDDLQDQINDQIKAASKKQPEAISADDNEEIILKKEESTRPAKLNTERRLTRVSEMKTNLDEEEELARGKTFDLSGIELPKKDTPEIISENAPKSIADLLHIEEEFVKNPPKKIGQSTILENTNNSTFYKKAIAEKTVFFPSSVKPVKTVPTKTTEVSIPISEPKSETISSTPINTVNTAKPLSEFSNIGGNLKKIELASTPESPILRKLRTLKGDIAEAMQSGRANVVSIAAAEADKRALENKELEQKIIAKPKPVTEKKSSNIITNIFAVFLSVLLIGGGSFAVYYLNKKQAEPITIVDNLDSPGPIVPVQFAVPIYVDEKNSSYIRANFEAERKRSTGKINEMGEVLFLTKNTGNADKERVIISEEFFSLLGMRPPISLIRTLHPHFMAGFHRFGEVESFLIFNTDTYDVARAGMLEWEKNMEEEVARFMRTPSDLNYPEGRNQTLDQRTFVDKVYKNVDTRVLLDENGKPLFLYAFVNRSFLIFTTNPETLSEVVVGLSARKVTK